MLSAAEAATVSRAVPKRRNEYATARWLAHHALCILGRPVNDLLSGPSREPLWPAGTIGSIAHSDCQAAVVVSRDQQLLGVDIDLEQRDRLDEKLIPKILTRRECDELGAVDPTLLFSAKEAVYKLLFPIVREYVGFHDVEVDIESDNASFSLRYVGGNPACQSVTMARGVFTTIDSCWLTCVMLWRREAVQTQQSIAPK